ncbi:hypothetical protein ES703_29048 [subsurface metagenome]
MNETIPKRPRHTAVDLRNNIPGIGDCGFNNIHRDTKTAQPIHIGLSHRNQGNIDGNPSGLKFKWYLGQKYRRVVSDTFLQSIANVISNKKAVHLELLAELLIGIRRSPHRQQMYDMSIVNVAGMFNQSVDKMLRLAAAGPDKYTIAGLN